MTHVDPAASTISHPAHAPAGGRIVRWPSRLTGLGPRLRDLSEEDILSSILTRPVQRDSFGDAFSAATCQLGRGRVGVGDDAAVLAEASGRTVVTTDSMVGGLDWRDDWSSPRDVGRKLITQNIADVVAMGARPCGVVIGVAAEPGTRLRWLQDLYVGVFDELSRCEAELFGGDLSSAPPGCVVLSVTALGVLHSQEGPFLRSAARVGERVVLSGPVGRSQAGLSWLTQHWGDSATGHTDGDIERIDPGGLAGECVRWHRAPQPVFDLGPARRANIQCAMDVSDGLSTDATRLAAASNVRVDFEAASLDALAQGFAGVVPAGCERTAVLSSGEEHVLLATCKPDAVPDSWIPIGWVKEGSGISVDGQPLRACGWQHFLASPSA